MDLWQYETLRVTVFDIYGNTHSGIAVVVNSADDIDSDEDEIVIEEENEHFFALKKSEILAINTL